MNLPLCTNSQNLLLLVLLLLAHPMGNSRENEARDLGTYTVLYIYEEYPAFTHMMLLIPSRSSGSMSSSEEGVAALKIEKVILVRYSVGPVLQASSISCCRDTHYSVFVFSRETSMIKQGVLVRRVSKSWNKAWADRRRDGAAAAKTD